MNPETIIAELRGINAWRRGDETIEQPEPVRMGEVLDAAADSLASLVASNATLRRERNAANDLHGTARDANAELADELARVSDRLSGAELERDKLGARVKELDKLYRDLRVAYEQNAHQCVKLNRELGLTKETTEWLNGATIQRERAEKAEARVKELEALAEAKYAHGYNAANRLNTKRREVDQAAYDELAALCAANAELAGALGEADLVCELAKLLAESSRPTLGKTEEWDRLFTRLAYQTGEYKDKRNAALARHAAGEPAKHQDTERLISAAKAIAEKLHGDMGWSLSYTQEHRLLTELTDAIDAARKEVQP